VAGAGSAALPEILDKCDSKLVFFNEYKKEFYFQRNKYMVDMADVLFAVWDGQAGGTANTVNYAISRKSEIYILNPKDFSFGIYNVDSPNQFNQKVKAFL